MRPLAGLAFLLVAAASTAAQPAPAPTPEACLLKNGQKEAASVDYGGKTYRFTRVGCRELFLSDPERYAQLFDALGELHEKGQLRPARAAASLVPS